MRLSVVVPALNEERNVARAVASAREGAGAADHCEVVVVDGGSDDATVSVAHSAGADAVLVSPERGRAARDIIRVVIAFVSDGVSSSSRARVEMF